MAIDNVGSILRNVILFRRENVLQTNNRSTLRGLRLNRNVRRVNGTKARLTMSVRHEIRLYVLFRVTRHRAVNRARLALVIHVLTNRSLRRNHFTYTILTRSTSTVLPLSANHSVVRSSLLTGTLTRLFRVCRRYSFSGLSREPRDVATSSNSSSNPR